MSLKEFVKIAVGLREHPKILQAGDDGGWLFVCAIMWSKEHDTDGFIPEHAVPRLTGMRSPLKVLQRCISAGLFEVVDGGWQIHDYLDIQESSERRKAAGRKAAEVRWERERAMRTASESHANRNANAIRNRNTEEEEEKEEELPPSPFTVDCEEWLGHYEQTTGHPLPGRATKAFHAVTAGYSARRTEGYSADDLKLATVGAHADRYRRENGYDVAESILRPTKIAALIAQGKLRSGRRDVTSAELGARLRGGAA